MRINKHLVKRMRIQYLYGPSVHVLIKHVASTAYHLRII